MLNKRKRRLSRAIAKQWRGDLRLKGTFSTSVEKEVSLGVRYKSADLKETKKLSITWMMNTRKTKVMY